jgi:hypothetical protein
VRSRYSRPTAQFIMCRRISIVRLIEAGFKVRLRVGQLTISVGRHGRVVAALCD